MIVHLSRDCLLNGKADYMGVNTLKYLSNKNKLVLVCPRQELHLSIAYCQRWGIPYDRIEVRE